MSHGGATLSFYCEVAVHTPAHGSVSSVLTWSSEAPLPIGSLVVVPLGTRSVLGLVWAVHATPPVNAGRTAIKAIHYPLDLGSPLDSSWRQLVDFAARYYQRSLGEMVAAALPGALRDLRPEQLARRLKSLQKRLAPAAPTPAADTTSPDLTEQQSQALANFAAERRPCLLWGATGSGKTEVYLQAARRVLEQEPQAQILMLVPEINLTPQLQKRLQERLGQYLCVSLHSGLTPAQRLQNWLLAHLGHARVLLGTRMAVFASLPHLRLIVVDEEHDPSYKSQEGARYSARDLAIYRGHIQGAQVLLGSATPSLETWQACERARYARLDMPSRVGDGRLPQLRLVNLRQEPRRTVISARLLTAMQACLAQGQQCLVFLNRRGYAPVLHCAACDWKSDCPHCSAYRVFHKIDRSLRCHHCGLAQAVPRACPTCGNMDIGTVGRGTEHIEEDLQALLPAGTRVLRLDADSTRGVGRLDAHLSQVHAGQVDVLVGTQMVTKGHDFRRIGLVAVLNTDTALFSSDFRAQERLFALLMQAAGRAGRDAAQSQQAELWVQTEWPQHPLFAALAAHDFAAFAKQQLSERQAAALPPCGHQALLRADAKSQDGALAYLQAASTAAGTCTAFEHVTLYPPVPHSMARIANIERAQMLVESTSRSALQAFLADWQTRLLTLPAKGLIRWVIDVDPLSI